MTAYDPFADLTVDAFKELFGVDGADKPETDSPKFTTATEPADGYTNVQTTLKLNDDGTLNITLEDVPLLELDDLLASLGSLEVRADILASTTRLVARNLAAKTGLDITGFVDAYLGELFA